MKFLKNLVGSIGAYFKSGKAASDADRALRMIGDALPYVRMAMDIVTSITPTNVDDLAWSALKKAYPTLLDGKPHTQDEVKLAALATAAHLLQERFPTLDKSIAIAAVQMAYLEYRADGK